jgi:predicted DCC family thiol-disulfide oxidoreductase YuxK
MSPLTLYYDGRCPLCQAEMLYLQHRDRLGLLTCVDITETDFDATTTGLSCERAMASIHGRLSNGDWLTGVAVFAAAYERVGLRRMAWWLSRPSLQPLLGWGYARFARHRYTLSRYLGPTVLRVVQRWLARSRSGA